jgi:hypothetical protein
MAESTAPKPESATAPQHPVKICEINGKVSHCVGLLYLLVTNYDAVEKIAQASG